MKTNVQSTFGKIFRLLGQLLIIAFLCGAPFISRTAAWHARACQPQHSQDGPSRATAVCAVPKGLAHMESFNRHGLQNEFQ
jgi:hypothetical protein